MANAVEIRLATPVDLDGLLALYIQLSESNAATSTKLPRFRYRRCSRAKA